MKNVFADIIDALNKKGGKAAQQFVKNLIQKAQDTRVPTVNVGTALQQAQNAMGSVVDRVQRGAQPVATMKDGSILFSDGSLKQTPISNKYNNRLKILRENVLAQQNFTPQTEAYLRSIPLNSFTPPGAWGVYNGASRYPIAQDRGGNILFDKQRETPSNIGINPDAFDAGGYAPASVMTHEFMHALDANINADNDASYYPKNETTGDSYGFYPTLDRETQAVKNQIDNFLSSYKYGDTQTTQDTEGYAEYGSMKGNRVLLGPAKNSYSQIFKPASKNINFTPVYPTKDIYSDIVTKLFSKQPE